MSHFSCKNFLFFNSTEHVPRCRNPLQFSLSQLRTSQRLSSTPLQLIRLILEADQGEQLALCKVQNENAPAPTTSNFSPQKSSINSSLIHVSSSLIIQWLKMIRNRILKAWDRMTCCACSLKTWSNSSLTSDLMKARMKSRNSFWCPAAWAKGITQSSRTKASFDRLTNCCLAKSKQWNGSCVSWVILVLAFAMATRQKVFNSSAVKMFCSSPGFKCSSFFRRSLAASISLMAKASSFNKADTGFGRGTAFSLSTSSSSSLELIAASACAWGFFSTFHFLIGLLVRLIKHLSKESQPLFLGAPCISALRVRTGCHSGCRGLAFRRSSSIFSRRASSSLPVLTLICS